VKLVLGLSGYRGSGKSTIASYLALSKGFAVVSFGDFVRSEAKRRGIEQSVESLQTLGAQLVQEWGILNFSARVLGQEPPDRDVVVDGIRHVDALHALRELSAPRRFVSVFVDVGDLERRRRLQERDNNDGISRDNHVVESEVRRLRELADFVISATNGEAERLIHELRTVGP
jgi:cytidylate kinase